MTDLKEYIKHYVTLIDPGYAVLVTGEWGVGKTYQVKSCFPEGTAIYVSLFGLQSVEELHSEVIGSAFPITSIFGAGLERITEATAAMKGPWALTSLIPQVFNSALKRDLQPTATLIFDDLERSNLKLKDILGAINFYVEHRGFRVVVVAHDEKLTGKFLSMKEKTFGQTIRVKPETDQALSEFIGRFSDKPELSSFLLARRTAILSTFIGSGIVSLRILRHVIDDLARLYDTLDQVQRQNAAAMDELVKTVVAFDTEIRSGNLQAPDLRNRRGVRMAHQLRGMDKQKEPPPEPNLIRAAKKYPEIDLEAGMLNDGVLIAMFIEGRYPKEEIRQSISDSRYFVLRETAPPWKTVIQFDSLEDDDVNRAQARMLAQFENREVTEPGELLHIFSLMLMMVENGITTGTQEAVVEACKRYVLDLLHQGRLPPLESGMRSDTYFDEAHDGYGYWVSDATRNSFQQVVAFLRSEQVHAFERLLPAIGAELLQLVRTNPRAFFEYVCPTNSGPNRYAYLAVLQSISASDFVDAWLDGPHESWRIIEYALSGRYEANKLDGELDAEREWALEVLAELDRRADLSTGFSALRIRRIRPKALVRYVEQN